MKLVKLKVGYASNNAGETCTFEDEVAEGLVDQGRAEWWPPTARAHAAPFQPPADKMEREPVPPTTAAELRRQPRRIAKEEGAMPDG